MLSDWKSNDLFGFVKTLERVRLRRRRKMLNLKTKMTQSEKTLTNSAKTWQEFETKSTRDQNDEFRDESSDAAAGGAKIMRDSEREAATRTERRHKNLKQNKKINA